MKTHNATRMAMGLIYLISLILFGCTQYGTADDMDTSSEGTITEMTDKNMGNTMNTKENKTMKGDMGEMSGKKMEGTMDTMKSDTMRNTMNDSKDKMMQDSSKEMMK